MQAGARERGAVSARCRRGVGAATARRRRARRERRDIPIATLSVACRSHTWFMSTTLPVRELWLNKALTTSDTKLLTARLTRPAYSDRLVRNPELAHIIHCRLRPCAWENTVTSKGTVFWVREVTICMFWLLFPLAFLHSKVEECKRKQKPVIRHIHNTYK